MKKVFILVAITVVILITAWYLFSEKNENNKNIEEPIENSINEDFIGVNNDYYDDTIKDAKFELKNQYDDMINLEDYRGKKVILFFWRIWCPPCQKELKTIENLYNELGNNEKEVILLTITQPKTGKEDDEKDKSSEEIIKYINENNYNFPVLFDEEKTVFREFNSITVPTIMIIDEKGNQVYKRSSSEIDVEQIMSYLN